MILGVTGCLTLAITIVINRFLNRRRTLLPELDYWQIETLLHISPLTYTVPVNVAMEYGRGVMNSSTDHSTLLSPRAGIWQPQPPPSCLYIPENCEWNPKLVGVIQADRSSP